VADGEAAVARAAGGTPKLTIPLLLSLMNKDSSTVGAGVGVGVGVGAGAGVGVGVGAGAGAGLGAIAACDAVR
jgi:hypothetical protein